MFIVIAKTVIIYLVIVAAMRIMGKKQAGQLQPYELVITLMIADIASTPMDDIGTPISYGLVPALTLMLLYFFFTFLTLKSPRLRLIFCGKPSILIHNGRILYDELRRSSCSLNDLIEQLRISGNTSIPEIHYAILETNGALSVLPYSAHAPATPAQLSAEVDDADLFICVIADGRLNAIGLHQLKKEETELQGLLRRHRFRSYSDILICMLAESGEYFIQDRQGNTFSCTDPNRRTKCEK